MRMGKCYYATADGSGLYNVDAATYLTSIGYKQNGVGVWLHKRDKMKAQIKKNRKGFYIDWF